MDKATQALTQLCPKLLCDPGQATLLLSISFHVEAGTEGGRRNDHLGVFSIYSSHYCLLEIGQTPQ